MSAVLVSRRRWECFQRVGSSTIAAALAFFCGSLQAQETSSLTVVSRGGSYAKSMVRAYHERFVAETGVQINLDEYSGGLAKLRAQAETGNVVWDVVDMEAGDLVLACDEGLVEKTDYSSLPPSPDGVPAEDDFFSNYQLECGAMTILGSFIVAYNANLFRDRPPPTKLEDYFDLEAFPGRRGMRRTPNGNLEMALVADGVAVDRVYEELSSEGGVARALRKLDTIKDHIVWWETGAHPPQILADGEVIMSTAPNGRIFNAVAVEKQPLVILWDGQVLTATYQAVVEGSKNAELARQFAAFATTTESLANVSKYISYSPLRHSSQALIDRHEDSGILMRPHMPNEKVNSFNAVIRDPFWWADHQDEMNEIFFAWLLR